MKFNLSLMIDPDLHAAAKRYADSKGISFARLVGECLTAVLMQDNAIDNAIRFRVEERIATHPGHKRPKAPEITAVRPMGDEEM